MAEDLQQTPLRVAALAGGLALWLSAGSVLAAAPESIEARLEIDTEQAGSGAKVLHRRIEERANLVLRQAKVLPGDRDDALLRIAVQELVGEDPGFAVSFELRAADGTLIADPIAFECSLCTETELVARVEAELETVIRTLREQPPPSPPPAEVPPPTLTSEPPVAEPPRTHAGLLGGGIALLLVGSGLLGSGVGLSIPEPRVDQDNPLDLITTRPIGYALIAGGIAAATTGAILTAIAVERRRKTRLSAASLGLVWRF